MSTIAPDIQAQWSVIAPILTIRTEQDYDQGIDRLNSLLDEVGTNEEHPLYTLLETLGVVIQAYEEAYHPMPDCSGREILAYFMEEYALSAADLPEIGSSNKVESILDGQQDLTIDQVRALANRFSVSPSVFI
ncbi:MAG: hypothetical protein WBB01_23915 [Phormidesmis sp.]